MKRIFAGLFLLITPLFARSSDQEINAVERETDIAEMAEGLEPIIASARFGRSTPFSGFDQQGLLETPISDTEFYGLLASISPTHSIGIGETEVF